MDKLKKILNNKYVIGFLVFIFALIVVIPSAIKITPLSTKGEYKLLTKFRPIDNTDYTVIYYKLEDDIWKEYEDVVISNINKNRLSLFKRPIRIELIKKDQVWELNKASNKRLKKKKDKDKYMYLKAYTNKDNQVILNGFQKYIDTKYLNSNIDPIVKDSYYVLTIGKNIKKYKVKSVKKLMNDVMLDQNTIKNETIEKELNDIL